MKRFSFALLLTVAIVATPVVAQEDNALLRAARQHGGGHEGEGPAYVGVVEAVVNGRRVPLERQEAAMGTGGMLGLGGKIYMEVPGARSSVRFRSTDKISFVARVINDDVDPSGITLLSIEVHKDTRRMPVIGTSSLLFGHGKAKTFKIPLTYEPFGGRYVRMVPTVPLAPGEYTFLNGQSAMLFGVD